MTLGHKLKIGRDSIGENLTNEKFIYQEHIIGRETIFPFERRKELEL